jgi:hypothetical protein
VGSSSWTNYRGRSAPSRSGSHRAKVSLLTHDDKFSTVFSLCRYVRVDGLVV